jgi:hypothetical protein
MVTSEEHLMNLVANAFGREMEVYAYQVNVDNYTTMLDALPLGPWPERLQDYRATPIEQLPVDMSEDDVGLIADFQYRDRITGLLRTEKVEQGKARRVLDALKSQIGDDYDALLAAHKAVQG